jgi:hypothetical protein
MAEDERRLALILGLLGALFLVLEGLIDLFAGVVLLAFGHGLRALGAWDHAIILTIVGLIVGFFAVFGRSRAGDRSIAAGVVLIVIALLGWLVLGLPNGILGVLGSILAIFSGLLYLVAGR